MIIKEPARDVPVLLQTDVVVAGGGPGGVAAALAAARGGAKVVLIERYSHLGGLATGGLVLILSGFDDGVQSLFKGIPLEISKKLEEMNGILVPEKGHCGTVDAEALKYLSLKLLEEAGVTVFFHALVAGGQQLLDGRIAVIMETKSGRQAVVARIAVDGTGDADIAHFLGAECERGHKGIGMVFRLGNVDFAELAEFRRTHPNKIKELVAAEHKLWGRGWVSLGNRELRPGVEWVNNTILPASDALDTMNLARTQSALQKKAWAIAEFRRKNMPGYENSYLLETACQLGVRETRRVIGEYMLTLDDVHHQRTFPDMICKSGAFFHRGVSYDIPYHCLVPKRVDNLLIVGRCISVDTRAQECIRVIPPCLATGQAAGTAAALAVKKGVTPRHVNMHELQDRLRADGAILEQPSSEPGKVFDLTYMFGNSPGGGD